MSASIGFFTLVFLTDAAKYGRHKGNEVEWRLAGWPRWVPGRRGSEWLLPALGL